nr:MAG TPA: hypothetical protein [Caudoviricetes sp.]
MRNTSIPFFDFFQKNNGHQPESFKPMTAFP